MGKAKLKKGEKVEITQPELLIEEEAKQEASEIVEEIIQEEKAKEVKKVKKEAPKENLEVLRKGIMASSITNRVSPSTIATLFCAYNTKEEVMKAIIAQFAPTLTALSAQEFKQITNELNKLID